MTETLSATTIPARLHIDPASGKLVGDAGKITYNNPWPTEDGTAGAFADAWGGVLHTEVGYEHNVIVEFNTLSAQASAFFSIGMDGHIHQYGPLGKDWMAWTQAAGNQHWRGVEHEDKGHPATPFSEPQLWSSAQVFEAMSAFDGWPLKATDDTGGRGIILHSDGGVPWGNHQCPGSVRAAQRPELIRRALLVRHGTVLLPGTKYQADGTTSANDLSSRQGCTVHAMWWATARAQASGFGPLQSPYIEHGNWDKDMPKGMVVVIP